MKGVTYFIPDVDAAIVALDAIDELDIGLLPIHVGFLVSGKLVWL